jgi:hypothetical protein
MNIHRLRTLRQKLITPNNGEWVSVISLRNLVRGEFVRQGYLTSQTYHTVLDWKLRRQRNRTERHREGNTEDLIRELTGTFWRVSHPNAEKEMEIKLKVLMAIPGTGLGVASAIFTLSTPETFAIIDFRNWRVLYNEVKRTFTLTEYKQYLEDIRQIALQLACDVQEVDYLLWKEYEKLGEQSNQDEGE